jgi:hypothetical protein
LFVFAIQSGGALDAVRRYAVRHLNEIAAMKVIVLIVPLLLLPSLAVQAATQPVAELQRCSVVAARDVRLACYDSLAAQLAAPTGTPTAAAKSSEKVGTVLAAIAAPAGNFGLEVQALKNEPEAIASQIDGLFEGWGPNRAINLANGQVWQINDGSSAVLYLKSPKVKIRRGILGTFVLELDGTNETAKVRRSR